MHSRVKRRVVLLDVSLSVILEDDVQSVVIPHDEGQVGDGQLAAREPLLLGEDRVEDGEHAERLLAVAFDGARDLFGGECDVIQGLGEVRAASHRDSYQRWYDGYS